MEINNIYNSYVAAYTKTERSSEKQARDKVKGETAKIATTDTAKAKQTIKEYMGELEQKYGVNITIGRNTTAKSFKNYMLGSSGGNNVYIESNIAEKMASDPEFAAKYEKLIAKIPEEGKQMQKDIETDKNFKMLAGGMQIHGNGKVTYWGVSLYTGPKVRMGTELREKAEEKLEKQRKLNKIKAEQQEKLQEKRAEQADTMEKLLEKMKNGFGEEIETNKKDIRNSIDAGIDIKF